MFLSYRLTVPWQMTMYVNAWVIVWVVCIPTLSPYGLIKPLWLDGPFLLVDKDYVSHLFGVRTLCLLCL
jgi:hypothetical protein